MDEPGLGCEGSLSAPARIDLAGGTVDIWPLCVLEEGAVTVNLGIDRRAQARVATRPHGYLLEARDLGLREEHADRAALRAGSALALHAQVALADSGPGLELVTRSGVPAGSGLGGSSTLLVAALAAVARLRGETLAPDTLLRRAMNLEARVIGVPTGSQDYLSAIHGGLGVVSFPPDGPVRETLDLDLRKIGERIVLAYTGLPHDSAINNWEITKGYVDGAPQVRGPMGSIAAAARDLADALRAHDLDAAGAAIAREWDARKRLAPGVTTALIERLAEVAGARGALATKVCGAGGGGCVFFWCREGARAEVAAAVAGEGAELLEFAPDPDGVR